MTERNTPRLGITWESKDLRPQAERLAQDLNLPLSETANEDFPLLLRVSARGLELLQSGSKAPGPVCIDFAGGALSFRRKQGGGRKQLLARAVGLKKGRNPSVVDATAGLGRDGFILAALGCRVLLVERSPVLSAMLTDGLARAAADPELSGIIENRLAHLPGDSIQALLHLPPPLPDVIYLDPMYPHRTKNALVKKEMRLLRALIGDDEDAPALLETALSRARERVVVKRPLAAPPVAGRKPTTTISGKKHRYDIYLQSGVPKV